MADIDKARHKLQSLVEKEMRAMTRLRRAQTLYEKYYNARLRQQMRIFEIEELINAAYSRLENK